MVFGLLIGLSALQVHAQGTVNFRTTTDPDNRVLNPDGSLVTTAQGYRAELMYAPDGTFEDQFGAMAVRIGADAPVAPVGSLAGAINAGTRTVPTN